MPAFMSPRQTTPGRPVQSETRRSLTVSYKHWMAARPTRRRSQLYSPTGRKPSRNLSRPGVSQLTPGRAGAAGNR